MMNFTSNNCFPNLDSMVLQHIPVCFLIQWLEKIFISSRICLLCKCWRPEIYCKRFTVLNRGLLIITHCFQSVIADITKKNMQLSNRMCTEEQTALLIGVARVWGMCVFLENPICGRNRCKATAGCTCCLLQHKTNQTATSVKLY